MNSLLAFAAALLASLALYVAVVSHVHRPLTVGDVPRMLQSKLAHAATLASPRLVIFAGSNGRYSHRCADMAEPLGLPCANMSVAVGVGLDFMLDQLERMLRPGDLVYMPLEYSQYLVGRDEMEAGIHQQVLVHELREQLWQQPLQRIARAHASFDLPYLVHGVIEMGLARGGLRRRTGLDNLTPEGDEQGHTAARGEAYRGFLAATPPARLDFEPVAHSRAVLQAFLVRQRERGVAVVGGLPTVPVTPPLPDATLQRLRQIYEGAGQHFMVLPGRSQYELTCFFDTVSHLNEACQRAHSRAVGLALQPWRPPGR